MTTYRKTMAEALKEVYLGESVIDKVKEIASKKSAKKIDGVMVDSFTASAISQIYDKVNDANKKKMEKLPITKLADLAFKMLRGGGVRPLSLSNEEVELDEAKYDLYHKDFSSAMQHAYAMAKKLYGITIDPKEIDDKVATGPSKPGSGKTNSYRLKGDKGAIQVQVYNKGGSKPFELNMYKEEVELDEDIGALIFGGGIIAGLLPVLYLSAKEIAGPSIGKLVDKLKKNKNYKMSDSEKSDVKGFVSKVKKEKPSLLQKAMKKIKEEVELDEAFKKGDKVTVKVAKSSDREIQQLSKKFGDTVSGVVMGQSGKILMVKTDKGQINPPVKDVMKEEVELDESKKALKAKSEKSGVSVGILSKVYDRGMAAWKTGHRPGTTPQQWALARVNSFLTGGGARKADNDLWQQAKKQKAAKKEDLDEGTFALPDTPKKKAALKNILSKPLPVGKEGDSASSVMGSIIGDDELMDDFYSIFKKSGPKADGRPAIKAAMKRLGIKEEVDLAEDGHADVPSAVRQCKTVMEDATQILSKLMAMGPEDSLPTWWTNKLAIASNSMNKMRDYLLVPSEMKEQLEEAMGDLEDLKKVVAELEKASKMHLAQSKRVQAHVDMMLAAESVNEQPEHEIKEARHVDPADIDTDATDDDVKSADKNIMMQMRKVISLRGNFKVEFGDKKKMKLPPKIAMAVQKKYDSIRRPADKQKFTIRISKSYKDMLDALNEGFASDAQRRAAFAQGYKAKGKKGKKEETKLDVIHRQLKEK